MNQETNEIICTAFDKGKKHDFKIFKETKLGLQEETKCLGDQGYQGINKDHKNSETPKKKTKKTTVSTSDKKQNRAKARLRIIAEHINRRLKILALLE